MDFTSWFAKSEVQISDIERARRRIPRQGIRVRLPVKGRIGGGRNFSLGEMVASLPSSCLLEKLRLTPRALPANHRDPASLELASC